jgi:hypothetical protein
MEIPPLYRSSLGHGRMLKEMYDLKVPSHKVSLHLAVITECRKYGIWGDLACHKSEKMANCSSHKSG